MQAALKLIVSSHILLLHIGNCKYSGNSINKPLYDKVLGIKNNIYIPSPSSSKIYGKELQYYQTYVEVPLLSGICHTL